MRKQRRRRRARGSRSARRVMLILGVGRTPFTFLPNSWGGDIVAKAGGELLTGGVTSSSGFERISDEVVVAEDPDVIIAVPHANEDDIPSLTEYLRNNPAWSTTVGRAQRPHLHLGRQLAAAGRHRRRPHDPQGAPRLPAELSALARRTLVFAALLVALVAATVASLALGAVKVPFSRGDRHPLRQRRQRHRPADRRDPAPAAHGRGAGRRRRARDRRGDPAGRARPTRSPRPT